MSVLQTCGLDLLSRSCSCDSDSSSCSISTAPHAVLRMEQIDWNITSVSQNSFIRHQFKTNVTPLHLTWRECPDHSLWCRVFGTDFEGSSVSTQSSSWRQGKKKPFKGRNLKRIQWFCVQLSAVTGWLSERGREKEMWRQKDIKKREEGDDERE